jgi:hypothetical protein
MEKRQFGNTDIQVSVLGFGGAEIGFEGATEEIVSRLLKGALDAGLNVIDTGECYAGSEELIGKAVGERRNDYYLFTKCGHPRGIGSEDWSRDSLLESIERSLRRLRTNYLDLIQLHSCSEAVLRKGEAIEALRTAQAKGYSRYIGYSGDGQAARYAVETGAFDALQTSINIADQEAIDLLLPPAHAKGMGVIAKRPVANVVWKDSHKPISSYHHAYWERLNKLRYDFIHDLPLEDSVAHAVRFTLTVRGVHTAIVGTTKPDRWKENARVVEQGPLSEAEFAAIRERWEVMAPASWIGQN